MARVGSLIILSKGPTDGSLPILSGDTVSIGRGPACGVRIRLTSVPPLAARLLADSSHAFLVNDSTAECTVLARGSSTVPLPVGEPVGLCHNDVLTFSSRAFRFEYGAFRCVVRPPLGAGRGATPPSRVPHASASSLTPPPLPPS